MKGREVEGGEVTKEESNEALRANAGPHLVTPAPDLPLPTADVADDHLPEQVLA